MKRLECLDGLRGGLAVYVMLSHMAPFAVMPAWITRALSHGGAAVDVFFVLSGLVIARSLDGFGYRARPFLIARAARIFPVFLTMFALAVACQPLSSGFGGMPWIAPDSPARAIWSDGWPRAWTVEIATHLTMTHGLLPDGILPDAWVAFLGAAWSLSTEWQFYILALLLGCRWGRSPWPWLGLATAGMAWAVVMPDPWHFSRAFLPNKAHYFALGIASAGGRARYGVTLLAVLALCGWQGGPAKLLAPLVWTLCLAAQLRPAWPGLDALAAVLRLRALQWLGGLSYCVYLANEPIQKGLGVFLGWAAGGDGVLFTLFWVPGALGLPLLAAVLLRNRIEIPALHWARRLR